MEILYTINKGYIDLMLASFLSLYRNSKLSDIKLHIITIDLEKEELYKLNSFMELFSDVKTYFYQLEKEKIEKYGMPDWRGSQIANSRLFFESIIGDNLTEKYLLYLDADTIVKNDLRKMQILLDETIGAVKDQCLKSYIKRFECLNTYYNSGVLLIDLEKWNKDNCEKRIIDFIRNSDIELLLPDQDVINYLFKDEITEFPLEYNMFAMPYSFNKLQSKIYFNDSIRNISYDEVIKAKCDPRILHAYVFWDIKPWQNNHVNPFNEEFMQYIYEINPNFKKEELTKLKRIISTNRSLFNTLMAVRPYFPEVVEKGIHKLTLRVNKNRT